MVYKVPIAYEEGATTILFPSKIEGLKAAKLATQGQKNPKAEFIYSFTPGSYYLTLRALSEKSKDVLTVIYNRKAYNLMIEASASPYYSVSFFSPGKKRGGSAGQAGVTDDRLISMLDQAKSYSLLSLHHPDAIIGIDYERPARIMKYIGFDVLIDEVFRFDVEDTIVFRILLRNNTAEPIPYLKDRLAVRAGDRIYPQSISDASGIIPAGFLDGEKIVPVTATAYFAITGTPTGGRNNLSVNNAWNILLPRETPKSKPEIVTAQSPLVQTDQEGRTE